MVSTDIQICYAYAQNYLYTWSAQIQCYQSEIVFLDTLTFVNNFNFKRVFL